MLLFEEGGLGWWGRTVSDFVEDHQFCDACADDTKKYKRNSGRALGKLTVLLAGT